MGRNLSHFPGIALESTGASAFQRIRTRRAEHASRLACQIYVHMGNFHPTFHPTEIPPIVQGQISPNRADSFLM